MARLYPAIDPASIDNDGERLLAGALATQLPDRLIMIHSFAWLDRNARGHVDEGECDFVILDPEQGLYFIEVKGGALRFETDAGEWLRTSPNGTEVRLTRDPFAQAQRNMHALVERVRRLLPDTGASLPCTFGYAVAFPHCRFTGAMPASATAAMIWDANSLADLDTAYGKLVREFRRPGHRALQAEEVRRVRAALFPEYQLVPVVSRQIEAQNEQLVRLTQEQHRVLQFLGQRRLAAIRGVAGSGKTLLALTRARDAVANGARTLLLCYNRALADWLQEAAGASDALVVDTFHGLVDRYAKQAGVAFDTRAGAGDKAFWTEHAPEALMQATDVLGDACRFDAIIVDEGQDFHELWWAAIDSLFRAPPEERLHYVFFDPNQRLYVPELSIPAELGEPFELTINCRNTVRIAEHCAALVGAHYQPDTQAPVGDAPNETRASDFDDALRAASEQARKFTDRASAGLRPEQVAILAPGYTSRQWPAGQRGMPLTQDLNQWREGAGVLLASWAKFKGLEADAAIVLSPEGQDTERERMNSYVARSRARHLLSIISYPAPARPAPTPKTASSAPQQALSS